MSLQAKRSPASARPAPDAAELEALRVLLSLGTPVLDVGEVLTTGAQVPPSQEPTATPERGGTLVATTDSSVEGRPSSATRSRTQPAHRFTMRDRLRIGLAATRWEIVGVLCAQALLSARLLGSNTAFGDEALYIYAGRLEIAHWLHGAAIPAFPTYFSGAPVIYPPIAAAVNAVGGLEAARAFSLVCILGATIFLWAITSRLFGRRAAFFAAGSWAVLGPTLHLASFATYDAFALLLVTAATWCVLHVGDEYDPASWMLAGGTVLALANAALYSSALYDPIVIALALFGAFPKPGISRGLARAGMVLTQVALVGLMLLKVGGREYLVGLRITTLSRALGDNSATAVLHSSWTWIGALVVMAFAALALSLIDRINGGLKIMLLVLAVAVVLAPLEQARMHTLVSLNKHVAYGSWFAAVAAGYFAERVTGWSERVTGWSRSRWQRGVTSAVLVGAVAILALIGVRQSAQMTAWPGAAKLVAYVRSRTSGHERFLAETDSVLEYYLPGTSWRQWSSTASITLPNGRVQNEKGAVGPYIQELKHHYFTLVILSFASTPGIDHEITKALERNSAYVLIAKIPFSSIKRGYYRVWEYRRPRQVRGEHSNG